MRIITWNCQGGFRRKFDTILDYNPDILLVQECEKGIIDILRNTEWNNYKIFWYGENESKGLALILKRGYSCSPLQQSNLHFKYVLPFQIENKSISFNLLAIWAMNHKHDPTLSYIGQVWQGINYYSPLLTNPSILLGDFNSNRNWDKKPRIGNHSMVVSKLADFHIESLYHQHYQTEQGKEVHPTFFLQRNIKKPYHIDYCFASKTISAALKEVKIGLPEKWLTISDHMPIILDFDV